MRLGKLTSRNLTSALVPLKSCILSRLLCSFPSTPMAALQKDPSVKILKFMDDTTVIGLIKDGDESAYRQEVEHLAVWCSLNNMELNTLKNCGDDSGLQEEPPCTPPTHYHGQHCGCSGVIQIPGNHHLSGSEVGL